LSVEEGRGGLVDLEEAGAPGVLLRVGRPRRQFDTRALGKDAHRVAEFALFLLHHEREDVSPRATRAEAVPALALRAHMKRRGALGMKRARRDVLATGTLQRHVLRYEVDDIDALLDLVNYAHLRRPISKNARSGR